MDKAEPWKAAETRQLHERKPENPPNRHGFVALPNLLGSTKIKPVAMQRSAVHDYTFKDGLHIPAGTQMSMPLQEVNLDPDIYPSPETFDGYRFLKLRETIDPHKFHYASVSDAAISFGGGTHACPGRFYASCELKLMLVEFLLRYEVRL